jgi:predicted porin
MVSYRETVFAAYGGTQSALRRQRLVPGRVAARLFVSAALLAGWQATAHAAGSEMPTKEPALTMPAASSPATPAACRGLQDFFLTDCLLAWYGVRFYGTIDVGYGYQTHGAPFSPYFVTGASYFLQKMNRSPMWSIAPNGMGQSNVGVQIKEPIGSGLSFIAQLEAGFDPYSLRFANSTQSVFENAGIPVNQQNTNGDASRAGQFYNSVGFVGISSDVYGALTVFRQNALTTDGVLAYDPMGGAYAFSPIGFSGTVAGGGDTENSRYSTAVKYRVTVGGIRAAALWQFGGYDLNNGSNGAWGAQLGADLHLGRGTLSFDTIVGYNKDAVNLTLNGAPTNTAGYPIGSMLPQTVTATLSDNTDVMVLAKYTLDRLRLYGGYEWMQFAPPSDPFTVPGSGFTAVNGDFVCLGCATATAGTNIVSTAYSASAGFKDKILQVVWAGARYDITDTVYVVGAYYHYDQNNFAASAANLTACDIASTNKNFCAGTMNAVSGVIDWKFAPKWDTYIGTFYSSFNGGLANGYLAHNNLATTGGVRFRF